MKKSVNSLLILLTIAFFSSCGSPKKVMYFRNIETADLNENKTLYDAKIMPKDQLNILVSTIDPKASQPFNLGSYGNNANGASMNNSENSLFSYLVDNNGEINFPIVGKIKVGGHTITECEDIIRQKIATYLAATERPMVKVRLSSYRVTVLGEVRNPGVFPVRTEKMTVLEALAQAGDLTIYGRRYNVLLIREDANGEKSYHRLNLLDANMISSPYYYLQQNDIIYVEPNKTQARNSGLGASTSMWFTAVGFITSMVTFTLSLLRFKK